MVLADFKRKRPLAKEGRAQAAINKGASEAWLIWPVQACSKMVTSKEASLWASSACGSWAGKAINSPAAKAC